jgi:hypothetical protein
VAYILRISPSLPTQRTVILGVLNTLQLSPFSGTPSGFRAAKRILHSILAKAAQLRREASFLRIVARGNPTSIAELSFGPPVLVKELIVTSIGIPVKPYDWEGNSDVRIVDRSCRLVDAVHSADVTIFTRSQGPRPFPLSPA